jgi:hypothetical protein
VKNWLQNLLFQMGQRVTAYGLEEKRLMNMLYVASARAKVGLDP